MGLVCDLVAERGLSWDDALHEVTQIRSEMSSLLQPRPRQLKQNPLGGKGDFPNGGIRSGPYSKGDGKKGDGKKGKKGSKGQRVAWVTEVSHGGQKHQLCMRYQVGKCMLADQCRYKQRVPTQSEMVMRVERSMVLFITSRRLTDLRFLVLAHSHQSIAYSIMRRTQLNGDFIMDSQPMDLSSVQSSSRDAYLSCGCVSEFHDATGRCRDSAMSSQVTSARRVVSPDVSLSSPWGPLAPFLSAQRVFLDVCYCVNRPISEAVLQTGCDVFFRLMC